MPLMLSNKTTHSFSQKKIGSSVFRILLIIWSSCIYISWVNASESVGDLQLTEREQRWLDAHTAITFTGDPNWLPYEAFDEQGNYIGIVAEHLKLIQKSTGLKFKMSPSKTWTESTEKAKQGLVDVLSETDDSDLKSHLIFTKPYVSNPIVIAMLSHDSDLDRPGQFVESINRISQKKIALIKDYGYASKIRRKYSNINFATVDNIQHGLVSVSTGEIDALLCTLALCSYTISELGLNNVRIVGKTEFDTKLALGVQKNMPELVSILNKAISRITPGEQQVILDAWIKQKFEPKTDYTLVFQILAAAIVLVAIFVLWNRRLQQEILLKSEIEKQLEISSIANERYRVLFFESPVGHALNSLETGDFISVNDSFSAITGYTIDELNTLSYWDLTPKRYEAEEEAQLKSLNEEGYYGPYEKHYIHKDGGLVAVRLRGSLITTPEGEKLIISIVEDISEEIEAKEKLLLHSLVLENSSEGMLITDAENKIVAINPAYTKILGYELDDVLGKKPSEFFSDRHDKHFYEKMWDQLLSTGQWQGETWNTRKDGDIVALWFTINTIFNDNGSVRRYVALFSDITERKLSEEMIWKQANFDSLTGLPNRNMFHDRLEQEVIKSKRAQLPLALLLIDLDQFKEVNDTLGHDIGDLLLQQAGKRINSCVRDSDTVARLGGDEFTVILSELHGKQHIEDIAQKIIGKLVEPYHLGDNVAHISGSIGITICPDDTTDIETLMKNADQAMYAAKKKGRNCFSYFTQSLQDAAQNRLRVKNDLRVAIRNEQFQLYYQPIIDLQSGKIYKAEALIRWLHPQQGMISPMDFIPLAEDTGFINEIGDWVFKEAVRQTRSWSTQYNSDFKISVNISPVQFKVEGQAFTSEWLHHLQELGLSGSNVIVEITESLLLNLEENVIDKLLWMRDAGIQVAIDDFGTGYSSLSYLKKFHIDYLKIDKSFIQNLETNTNDYALVEAIIVMAHKLGLKVIAEGVETEAQKNLLAETNCDFAQGYFYSKPVPAQEFEQLLTSQTEKDITKTGYQ